MTSTTGPARRNNRPPPRAAFTLIELVMVMLLISAVLALAAPSLRGFVAARQTPNAAAMMLSLLRYARTQAMAQGSIHLFHIGPDGEYWITRRASGFDEPVDGDMGRRFRLPEGTTAEMELAGQAGAETLALLPDGRTRQASITLTGADATVVRILADSATDRFRIEEEKDRPR